MGVYPNSIMQSLLIEGKYGAAAESFFCGNVVMDEIILNFKQ